MRRQIIQDLDVPFYRNILKYDYSIDGEKNILIDDLKVKGAVVSNNFVLIEEDVNFYIKLLFYDIKSKQLTPISYNMKCYVILPDERILVSENNCVKVYKFQFYQKEIPISNIRKILIFEDKVILYGKKIFLWDFEDQMIQIGGDDELFKCVCLSGNRLITGCKINQIKIWNLQTFECESILTGYMGLIDNVLVLEQTIISTCLNGYMRFWKNGVCQKTIRCDDLDQIITVGNKIITSYSTGFSSGKELKVWDECSFLGILKLGSFDKVIIQALPNNQLIGSCGNSYKIWDLDSMKCIKTFNDDYPFSRFISPCVFENRNALLTNNRTGLVMYQ